MKKIALLALFLVMGVFILASCGECEHEWGEWSVSSPSTCAAQGTKQRKCSKCDEVQTESIDIADHEYDTENLVWTWNGYESATATLSCVTDSTHTRQIGANVTDEVTTEPTCTATGTKIYTATVKIDGVTYTATKNETLAALGHTEVADAAVAATCEKTGLTEGSHCSVCKEVLLVQTETALAEHTEEIVLGSAATCTEAGLTDGKRCSVCEIILIKQEVIDAKGHNWDSNNVVWTWDGYSSATATFICSGDANHTEVVDATISVTTKEPTYGEDGYTKYTATVSLGGHSYTDEKTTYITLKSIWDSAIDVLIGAYNATLIEEYSDIDVNGNVYYTFTHKFKLTEQAFSDSFSCSDSRNYIEYYTYENDKLMVYEYANGEWTKSVCTYTGYTVSSFAAGFGKESLLLTLKSLYGSIGYDAENCIFTANEIVIDGDTYIDCTLKIEDGVITSMTATRVNNNGTMRTICLTLTDYDTTEVIIPHVHEWDNGTITKEPTETENGIITYACNGCTDTHTKPVYAQSENSWNAAFENAENTTNFNATLDATIVYDGETILWQSVYHVDNYKVFMPSQADYYNTVIFYERIDNVDYSYSKKYVDGQWIFVREEYTYGNLPYTPANLISSTTDIWNELKNSYEKFTYNAYTGTYYWVDFVYETPDATISDMSIVILDKVIVEVSYHATTKFDGEQEIKIRFSEFGVAAVEIPHVHKWSDWAVETESTCTANGLKKRVCDCGIEETEILYSEGHNYEAIVTAPTCEAQGYTTHTCSMCKESFVDTYVDELGHNWGAWEISGSYTLRNCINECNCGKYQRITSINAIYNGIRLLTGESVWKNDVTVTVTLSDNTTIDISDFTLENDVMTVDGTNYVTVNFHTASTVISVPAIYNNLPGTTSVSEFTYTEEDDAITITGFIGTSTGIIIPAHINRVPVRYIGESAFNGQENIKSVVIPDSIYRVGVNAFNNCKRMTSLTLGKGLTFLDIGAFANCISLTAVDIPNNILTLESPYWSDDYGVFENCTAITKVTIGNAECGIAEAVVGNRAFQNCSLLNELTIGNNIKVIGESAFNGCTSLTTLTIGSGVEIISAYAFNNCENLKAVAIPNSVTTIGSHAFNNCKRMATLTLGNGLTFLDIGAFANCISLKTVAIPASVLTLESPYWSDDFGVFENCTGLTKVTIGDETADIAETVIGKRAFQNCTNLSEVFIGNKVQIIGENAFNGCTSLVTLTIGTGVENINAYAFNNCESLISVDIPDSVVTIGSHAFNNCKRMTSLTFGSGLTFLDIGAFANCSKLTSITIPVNVLTLESPYWSDDFGVFENCTGLTKIIIGDDTIDIAETVIGKRAFKNCTSLVELYIGNKVKVIGESSFEGCTALTTLTIGDGVQEIQAFAFNNCEVLSSVQIPDSVKIIGSHAFNNCKKMMTLTLGKGLTYLDIGAFANCISLTSLNIPTNVLTLESPYWNDDFGVFENCTGLKKVTIGDDIVDIAETVIGKRAFKNCTSLVELYIGNKVKIIGESSFEGCTALTTLTIGSGVQEIHAYAFNNCEAITSVTIPDSVLTIGSHAFNNCKKMTALSLGKGLTYLDIGAFANCISLTSLNIPANVLTLESPYWSDDFGVFENCTGLIKVIIGDDTVDIPETTIGERAFKGCTALEEVYIGSNVKTIADNAFEGCVSLTDVQLGTGAQSVGSYAFANCTDLNSITIPDNVMTLGNNIFNNCTALEDVTIVSGKDLLRSFGSNIFNGCTSLDRIYYTGTADDWALITISEDNCYPLNVTPYYYSENKPTTVDNYWYYNGNGAKRVWNVSETSFNAEFSSENFVEIFGDEDSSYSTTFFNELDNDSTFKSGLYAWETLHMIADTSFSEGVWKVSKKDLYKLVIFDLLCGEANAQETIVDAFDTSTVAYIDDLAKDIFGQEVTHDFLKSISPKLDYSTKLVKYNVIGLQYIFESHSNMYDALKSCATYLVLADMDESFQTVLLQIANDSSNPWELREAAREYAEIFKMSASQILANYAIEYYSSDVRAAFTIFSDLLWDKTVEMVFPEFAIAQSIAKGILFLADLGCNIDGIYMTYYKLDVAVHLEASLRKIIHNTEPDYFRASNRTKSEVYVYAVDMYKTSVLLGFDYSNNLLSEDCEKKSDEEKEAYIAMMNTISSMKADKQALYNRFDNLVSQAYVAYYS